MNTQNLEKTFRKMKADIKVVEPTRGSVTDYNIGFQKGMFIITTSNPDELDIQVIDNDVKDRHVLLNISHKDSKNKTIKDKWLCGHDERDWFVGAIPKVAAKTIFEAKESLKPAEVIAIEKSLPNKKKHKRKNKERVRQGEWFFIPMPDFQIPPTGLIHKNEPISRGGGSKNHTIQEVYRTGGTSVYANSRGGFITPAEYEKLKPSEKIGYLSRKLDAAVYARGTVKHADHATITLDCWHKVLMNTENTSRAGRNLIFLD